MNDENNRKLNALYMISTPLNLFLASGIALSKREEENAYLCFIDQISLEDNLYIEQTKQWKDSPFLEVHAFSGRGLPAIEKWNHRKKLISSLRSLAEHIRPVKIYTGNDRRYEFQYLIHHARRINESVTGIYLDDGMCTYVRRNNHRLRNILFDQWLKKIFYGIWWDQPAIVGASKYIDECWLAFPEHVHPIIKKTIHHKASASLFSHSAIRSLSQQLLLASGMDITCLQNIDILLTLPHVTIMDRIPNYRPEMIKLVETITRNGGKAAIKYHPRQIGEDEIGLLKFQNTQLIPANASFEALLPSMPANIAIVGDISTTLLSARWLRDDLRVISIGCNANKLQKIYIPFFKKIGVIVLDKMDDLPPLLNR
ncbi:MAG: polysialyltransferase family glycosyltransferase [Candidatus Omnitrophota bacterium]